MLTRVALAGALLLTTTACVPSGTRATPGTTSSSAPVVEQPVLETEVPTIPDPGSADTPATTTTAPSTTTTTIATFELAGSVFSSGGSPLAGAFVRIGDGEATTAADGRFELGRHAPGTVTVFKPAWMPVEIEWDGEAQLQVELEPRIVRAPRVSRYVSMEPDSFEELLDLAERTVINALVFDTKDETGSVLYETSVKKAVDLGAVDPHYDPAAAVAAVHQRGLYAITRLVTFEDRIWVAGDPDAKLIGAWADPSDPANWEYPLDLAVEACELGFDEVQFDYVRFPAGQTGAALNARGGLDQAGRVEVIQSFLAEAHARLHPRGCAVSAAIFGIVMSSPTDEGIGQRPEELSVNLDAVSPMIYPSHYSNGWLGFADPNDHPGPVTADALDQGAPRLAEPALLRPWLQAFYYNGTQVQAGIEEAEARGHGWMLWNAGGNYAESWIPVEQPAEDGAESEQQTSEEPVGEEEEAGDGG
jgi:hypothetical protein